MVEDIPADATAQGYCDSCREWKVGRIIAEVHSDSGGGGTVIRCPACCENPRRRRTEHTRTWLD